MFGRKRQSKPEQPSHRATVLATTLACVLAAPFAGTSNAADAEAADYIDSRSLSGSYLAGRHAERVSDYLAAVHFLEETYARDPANMDIARQLFLLLVAEGRIDEALELAPTVRDAVAGEPLPVLVEVLKALGAGDYQTVVTTVTNDETIGLNEITLPIIEAWALAAMGQGEEALVAIDEANAAFDIGTVHILQRAMIMEYLGDVEGAATAYQEALTTSATPPFALLHAVASYYRRAGRPEDARAVYEDYAQSPSGVRMSAPELRAIDDPEAPLPPAPQPESAVSDLLFSIASSLDQEGNEVFGYVYARLAQYLNAENDLALSLIAQVLESQGRHEASIAVWEDIPLDSTMGVTALLAKADTLHLMGRTDEAIASLEEMAAAYPQDFAPYAAIGNYLRSQEDFQGAVVAYDQAFERIPEVGEEHWTMLYYRGIALERSDMWDRAEQDFLRALDFAPDQPFVLNYLGYSWVEQGVNLDEARTMIESAVEQRPRDGFIVDSLGWVLYRLGFYEEAVPQLERAVELQPGDPVINDHLGDALWRVGRRMEARFQWQRAAELEPDEELAATIADKLQNGLDTDTDTDTDTDSAAD